MPSIMSANRLNDGKIVYLDKDGRWTENIVAAQLYPEKAELEAAEQIAKQAVRNNLIIDPSPVSLTPDASAPSPQSLRDAIRAKGPTIAYGQKPVPRQV